MRRFLLAAVMCGMTAGAQAADLSDLPILRGGLTEGMGARVNWSGVYVGGQVTRGAADMDFTNSGQDLLAKLLNNIDVEAQFNISKWPVGERAHASGTGYGGFAGYNFQWTDAVIGVELNYTHGTLFGSSKGGQARTFQFPTDYVTTATVSSSSSMRLTDYGSLRVRGGYAVGSWLPYAFVGVALGQADINRRAEATISSINMSARQYRQSPATRAAASLPTMRTAICSPDSPPVWLQLDVVCGPVHAGRIRISPLHLDGRYQREHRPPRARLQVLIQGYAQDKRHA